MTQVALTRFPEEQVMAMESHIQFKTGSETVEPVYNEQLALVARALRHHDTLSVRLSGYADNRGDERYNQSLSEQRASAVKQALISLGVDSAQIETVALGESNSLASAMEDAFFDRKVVMQIMPLEEAITAKR